MKKLMAVLAGLFLASAVTFADKVIEADDLNSKWIVGNWTLEVSMEENGEAQTETAEVEIKGKKDSSKVIIKSEGEEEETTLEELKDMMFVELPGQIPLTDEIIAQSADYGITIGGDTAWRLTDDKKQFYFALSIAAEDQSMVVKMTFTKKD
ncbi:hypothetical protein [Treponema sp.]|uniref:hypothetical protein n=1 Tax=Treponema sp. TaxID=166 RepID=UPI0025E2877C|nr:hypothetical protein [Treponema sp.]MCR5218487.1 hypothetical protein [Treponema sp.]